MTPSAGDSARDRLPGELAPWSWQPEDGPPANLPPKLRAAWDLLPANWGDPLPEGARAARPVTSAKELARALERGEPYYLAARARAATPSERERRAMSDGLMVPFPRQATAGPEPGRPA